MTKRKNQPPIDSLSTHNKSISGVKSANERPVREKSQSRNTVNPADRKLHSTNNKEEFINAIAKEQ
jgi:hypothetical protein